jgi:RNA 3'-terminal phosphate cyclase (ATP)
LGGRIVIDGSLGEGGGQILRTALALSIVTGRPFRIEKIRAARRRPGLLHQHLAAVDAAARVGGAGVEGATLGSSVLVFEPSTVAPGTHVLDIGTAGSTALVIQTVLPALLTAPAPSLLRVTGGTYNPFSPPFDFLERVFLPALALMGPRFTARLIRAGFFPAGGGVCEVAVRPCERLAPVDFVVRGPIVRRRAKSIISRLPRHIAEREMRVVKALLGWREDETEIEVVDAHGPGNALLIEVCSERAAEISTGFGERGKTAETVATEAVAALRDYLDSGAAVGENLADQLLVPLALARGGSLTTSRLSRHAETNMRVIGEFLDIRFRTRPSGAACLLEVV